MNNSDLSYGTFYQIVYRAFCEADLESAGLNAPNPADGPQSPKNSRQALKRGSIYDLVQCDMFLQNGIL